MGFVETDGVYGGVEQIVTFQGKTITDECKMIFLRSTHMEQFLVDLTHVTKVDAVCFSPRRMVDDYREHCPEMQRHIW